MKSANGIYLIISCLTLMTVSCQQADQGGSSTDRKEHASQHNPTASTLYTDLQGNPVSMEDFKGKTVFMNYWATWCRPCLAEMPDIDSARLILEQEGIKFLAVSDEPLEKIKKFSVKHPYGFTYLKLNTAFTAQDIYSLPTTIIYMKDGSIGLKKTGAMDWNTPRVLNTIRSYQ